MLINLENIFKGGFKKSSSNCNVITIQDQSNSHRGHRRPRYSDWIFAGWNWR